MNAGISVKHLSSGLVHIIATAQTGTVRLTVDKAYARKVARALLGDESARGGDILDSVLDLLKRKGGK